jgi:hypothetical protein
MARALFALVVLALALSSCSREEAPPSVVTTSPPASKPAGLARPRDYDIRLAVPAKVGALREIELFDKKSVEQKEIGKKVKTGGGKTETVFTGTIKTLAVNDQGQETKVEITIDRFVVAADNNPPQAIAPTGSVVVAEWDKDATRFQLPQGAKFGPLADQLLGEFFDLKTGVAAPTDVEIFASDRRQAVGSRWPANKEKAQEFLKGLGRDIAPEQIAGSAQLVRLVPLDDVECLEFQFQLSLKQPAANSPIKGFKGASTVFQRSRTELYPTTYATGPAARLTRVSMQQKFQGVPGTQFEDMTLEINLTGMTEEKIQYLRK